MNARHQMDTIDTEDATTLQYSDFCTRYMALNRPVLLRNVTAEWFPKTEQWRAGSHMNFQYLRECYGSALVPVTGGDVAEDGAQDRWEMQLDEYLDLIESKTAGKNYLKDWHFVHAFGHDVYEYDRRSLDTPPFFKDDWLNWWWDHKEKSESDYRFVYLGPAGSWTPLHHDVFRSYSWSVNICGRKEWIFYPPDDEEKLKDRFGRFVVPDVTAEAIDETKYPLFHEAKLMHVVQEAGDAVFVPSGWYHQVKNVKDTISINHNWFNGYNIREVWGFLRREYAAVEHELDNLKDVGLVGSDFVDQCQVVMLANTGMNYVEFRELLYAKAIEMLSQREHSATSDTALVTQDLLRHLGYVHDILQQLNVALSAAGNEVGANISQCWIDVDSQLERLCKACSETAD